MPAFSSVESFWALWSRLVPLSALKRGAIYMFREHTKPTWESWPDGGKWELSFAADAPADLESRLHAVFGARTRSVLHEFRDAGAVSMRQGRLDRMVTQFNRMNVA